MTIDEAIKILTSAYRGNYTETSPKFGEAIRLGIEALRLLLGVKPWHLIPRPPLLPGETEE